MIITFDECLRRQELVYGYFIVPRFIDHLRAVANTTGTFFVAEFSATIIIPKQLLFNAKTNENRQGLYDSHHRK